jgi:hypothetical protein
MSFMLRELEWWQKGRRRFEGRLEPRLNGWAANSGFCSAALVGIGEIGEGGGMDKVVVG